MYEIPSILGGVSRKKDPLKLKDKIQEELQNPLCIALLLSIIMHIAFVPILVSGLIHRQWQVEYTPVYFKAIERDVSSEETLKEKEPEYNPPENLPEGQVVDAPIPPEIDDKSNVKEVKFLSDKTVRTRKESKSRASVTGSYEVGSVAAGPSDLAGEQTLPGAVSPEMTAGDLARESEKGEMPLGPGKHPVTVKETPPGSAIHLYPTFKAVSEAVKGSGLDKLDGVEEGEKTLLNTDEWKHAGFFLRVKNAVAQYWNPGAAFLMYDPMGRVYGYKDRETIVKVVLDCEGAIKHLYVMHPSGAKFLDDEALDALKSAGPFPNPPKPLCDQEDRIIVFNFGFFVKVGDKPVIRVKRY